MGSLDHKLMEPLNNRFFLPGVIGLLIVPVYARVFEIVSRDAFKCDLVKIFFGEARPCIIIISVLTK